MNELASACKAYIRLYMPNVAQDPPLCGLGNNSDGCFASEVLTYQLEARTNGHQRLLEDEALSLRQCPWMQGNKLATVQSKKDGQTTTDCASAQPLLA